MGSLIIKSKKHGDREVLFDDSDYDIIMSSTSWVLHPRKDTFYAYCQLSRKVGRKKIYMHRLIMGFPEGKDIDHKDGNGLNNQRSNLRIATRSQNISNQTRTFKNKSGFKGVYLDKKNNTYMVFLQVNSKIIRKSGFKTALEAAKKYNQLATIHHGEFAKLNHTW